MDVKFLKGTYAAYLELVGASKVDDGTFYLCDNEQEEDNKSYRLFLGKTEITADGQVQTVIEDLEKTIFGDSGGTLSDLDTSDKSSLVGAINSIVSEIGETSQLDPEQTIVEALLALKEKVGADETSLKVTVEDTTASSENLHKQYTVKQGGSSVKVPIDIEKITIEKTPVEGEGPTKYTFKWGNDTIGDIDIPKDLVVQSGKVVVVTSPSEEGQPSEPGTYIELTLNDDGQTKIYINVKDLVDDYTANNSGKDITVTINKREISAEIASSGVNTDKIADNAVTNAKLATDAVEGDNIKNGVVTNEKLSSELQAKLKDIEDRLTWGTFPPAE